MFDIEQCAVPRRRGWGISTKAMVTMGLAVAAAVVFRSCSSGKAAPFQLRPSTLPKVKDSRLFDDAYREELFWGTYRPGFYCGVLPCTTVLTVCSATSPVSTARREKYVEASFRLQAYSTAVAIASQNVILLKGDARW